MTAADVERFWSYVVKGPAPTDCWIWTGAIGDDGYGRFWTLDETAPGGQRVARPQRFAYTQITGVDLPSTVMLLHACDVPLCVHASTIAGESHVTPGTHQENMIDRAQKGRHENRWTALRYRGLPRQERARLSRELRDTVLEHGWDPERIRRALNGIGPDQPTLW